MEALGAPARPMKAKTICETPPELSNLDYKLFVTLDTDFELQSTKKRERYVYPPTAPTAKKDNVSQPCVLGARSSEPDAKCSAIFHRKRWPARITITLSHDDMPGKVITKTAPIPIFDTTTAYKVPIRGKALVEVKTNAAFDNGQLVFYEDIRPSTAARAILFPAELIASTFGVVVAVVTLAL